MWLFTQSGFFSIVKVIGDNDKFFVRARHKNDLENLIQLMNLKHPIHESNTADYPFRILICHQELLDLTATLVNEIEYPNFKSKIAETKDQYDKLPSYHEVWSIMRSCTY